MVVESGMRANLVVVNSPGFNDVPRLLQGSEPVLVQALRTEASVEGLDVGIVGRGARQPGGD
jgi:hypothetical protein